MSWIYAGAVAALGAPGVIVHGLRVRPGKPTVLAAVGSKPVIGLPGNPTSALVILEAVAAPIVAALAGAPAPRARFGPPGRRRGAGRGGPGSFPSGPFRDEEGPGSWTAWPLPRSLRVREPRGASRRLHRRPWRSRRRGAEVACDGTSIHLVLWSYGKVVIRPAPAIEAISR